MYRDVLGMVAAVAALSAALIAQAGVASSVKGGKWKICETEPRCKQLKEVQCGGDTAACTTAKAKICDGIGWKPCYGEVSDDGRETIITQCPSGCPITQKQKCGDTE